MKHINVMTTQLPEAAILAYEADYQQSWLLTLSAWPFIIGE